MNIDSKPRALTYSRYLGGGTGSSREGGKGLRVQRGGSIAAGAHAFDAMHQRTHTARCTPRRPRQRPTHNGATPRFENSKLAMANFPLGSWGWPSPQQHLVVDHGAQRDATPGCHHILGLEVLDGVQVRKVDCGRGGGRRDGVRAEQQGRRPALRPGCSLLCTISGRHAGCMRAGAPGESRRGSPDLRLGGGTLSPYSCMYMQYRQRSTPSMFWNSRMTCGGEGGVFVCGAEVVGGVGWGPGPHRRHRTGPQPARPVWQRGHHGQRGRWLAWVGRGLKGQRGIRGTPRQPASPTFCLYMKASG